MKYNFTGINIITDYPHETFLFYKNVGLAVLEECDKDDYYYGATLGLYKNDDNDKKDKPIIYIWRSHNDKITDNTTLVFHIDNLRLQYEEFVENGILCEEPTLAEWGGYELMLKDPNGNILLFLE